MPKAQLPQAIAQNQARHQGAGIVSQPLGGLLFAAGRSMPFPTDAISYAVSFVSLLFVRPAFQEERDRTETKLVAEIVEGIRFLWRQTFLRTTFLLVAGTNFRALVGAMLALFSGGALIDAFIAPWVQRNVPPSTLIIGSLWLWAGLTYALFFVRRPLVLGALCGLQAVVGPPWNVVIGAYRYLLVPDRLLRRVSAAGSLVTWGSIPLGVLAAGYLAQGVGPRATFLVLGCVFTVVAVTPVCARVIRHASSLEVMMNET